MKVGINYVSDISRNLIRKLVANNIINVLKFPGIQCNEEEKKLFLKYFPSGAEADIHGLLHFNPAWNMPNIAENTSRKENLSLLKETGLKSLARTLYNFLEVETPSKTLKRTSKP